MVRSMLPGGSSSPPGPADVIGTIPGQGQVIGACIRVSLVGIGALTIDARILVASVDTYLRFAGAVSRQSSVVRETMGVLQGIEGKLREFAEPEGRPVSGRLRSREGY